MIEIKFVEVDNADLLMLVSALDSFFYDRYQDATLKYQKYHDLSQMACAAVAYLDGGPAGCCCWKPVDAVTAEIKRMFVRQVCRGQGIARQLAAKIEAHAAASGCHRAVLETGADMADAIAVYEKLGSQICEGFGDFTDDHAVTCMEKEISDGTMR